VITDQTKPCASDSCTCRVPLDQIYCSDVCRKVVESEISNDECECGHNGCDQGF
jgi:hypothetical protein